MFEPYLVSWASYMETKRQFKQQKIVCAQAQS